MYKGKLMSDVEYEQLIRSILLEDQMRLERDKQQQVKPSVAGFFKFYAGPQSYKAIKDTVVEGINKLKDTKIKKR